MRASTEDIHGPWCVSVCVTDISVVCFLSTAHPNGVAGTGHTGGPENSAALSVSTYKLRQASTEALQRSEIRGKQKQDGGI